jgi:hypothetical protein
MSTNSRFPVSPATPTPISQGVDNTSRFLNNDYQAPAYAATIALKIFASNTIVQVGLLTGALALSVNVGSASTPPYVGDRLKVLFTSTAGATVTLGAGFLFTAATIVIPATKTANATFVFNGASWVEEARAITI